MLTHQLDAAARTLEFSFGGNLLSSNVDEIRAAVGAALATLPEGAAAWVWRLDLRRADFIDSSGLNLLVELCRQAAARQCRLEAQVGHPKIKRLFAAVRLDRKISLIDAPVAAG
jgi:anti-anti-sigma factor